MKKIAGKVEGIVEVDRFNLHELSASLRHFSEATEQLNDALTINGINQRKQEDQDKTSMEQLLLMSTIQHKEHE